MVNIDKNSNRLHSKTCEKMVQKSRKTTRLLRFKQFFCGKNDAAGKGVHQSPLELNRCLAPRGSYVKPVQGQETPSSLKPNHDIFPLGGF